jgi:hypothetical protein
VRATMAVKAIRLGYRDWVVALAAVAAKAA